MSRTSRGVVRQQHFDGGVVSFGSEIGEPQDASDDAGAPSCDGMPASDHGVNAIEHD